MPGGFTFDRELCNAITLGQDAANSKPGLVLTPGTGTNTMGSWVQVTSALAVDACWIEAENTASTATDIYVVQIGVGGAGAEVVVAEFPMLANTTVGQRIGLPVDIPAGSRVAARCAAAAFSRPAMSGVQFKFFAAAYQGQGAAGSEVVGAVYTNVGGIGTAVAASATINTKGSWTQLVAATPKDYDGFAVVIAVTGSGGNPNQFLFDIGIGGAGAEQIILPDFYASGAQFQSNLPAYSQFIPMQIPAGTRLAARCQANNTNAANHIVMIVGVRK